MKQTLLCILGACAMGFAAQAQTRYLDEVFPTVTTTTGVTYGQNFHFIPLHDSPIPPTTQPAAIPPLGYTPTVGPMTMDVYQPTNDAETNRPLVILIHTGNFLPRYVNRSATGDKTDSAVVELSTRFAKRGYVAVAPRYRLGWNPTSTDPVTRVRTLLNAVYRSIHDVQTCVRFFKRYATDYKVNPHKIILVGVGSGGYVANAYATLDKQAETMLDKFQDDNGNSVVDPALVGDVNGQGGTWNQYNHPGFTNKVAMTINMGGALGDISWLEAGDVPMVGFHCWKDVFAPYDSGTVIVPTTGDIVVDVHGTRTMIKKAVALGNNNLMVNHTFSDAVSARAYSLNAKAQFEGLFEFRTPPTPAGSEEGSPWDWWDSTSVVTAASFLGIPSSGTGANGAPNNLHLSGLINNPNMSGTKGRKYIDTVMAFSCPRIYQSVIIQPLGVEENIVNAVDIKVFPNPVVANFSVTVDADKIRSISVLDLNGRLVKTWNNINTTNATIDRGEIAAGVYLVKINTAAGEYTRKVVFK